MTDPTAGPDSGPDAAAPPLAPVASRPVLGAWRALLVLAAFLGAQLVVAVVAGVWVGVRHARGGAAAAGQAFALDAGAAIAAALIGTLVGGLAVLGLVRRSADGWAAVGWVGAPVRACVGAALQGFGLVAVFVLLGRALPEPRALGPLATLARAGGWSRAAWAVLAFVLAPPVEELVFRGALYAGLRRAGRPAVAAVVTTLVFVGLHATEIGRYGPAWIAIGALGALALRARLATGSLVPAVVLHASYNLGLVLAVYAGG
jgi:membrane protease YdiL (CAAX protease family)